MKVAARTHIGNVRKINQDCYWSPESGECTVLVADGMGGHKAGEVASAIAVQTLRDCVARGRNREISVKTIVSWVRQANKAIFKEADTIPEYMGMGTTLTMLYFMQGHAMLAHVGDSRCYLLRNQAISQLTQDHSLVAELVRCGSLDPDKAKDHPYRNMITRALGTEETVAVDAQDITILNQDMFVLCSDGLSNYIEPEEMQKVIGKGDDLDASAQQLVDMALVRGGRDNITVVLVQCDKEVCV